MLSFSLTDGSAEFSQSRGVNSRLHTRYSIALDLCFKLLNNGRVEQLGVGRTINISSGGVLFETQDDREANDFRDDTGTIVVEMTWPFVLNKVCALKLVMRGRIVRWEAGRVAVKVEHHAFHTAGLVAQKEVARSEHGGSRSERASEDTDRPHC